MESITDESFREGGMANSSKKQRDQGTPKLNGFVLYQVGWLWLGGRGSIWKFFLETGVP